MRSLEMYVYCGIMKTEHELKIEQGALPDRKILSKVWSKTQTPIFAVIATVSIGIIFGLLGLASLVAVRERDCSRSWETVSSTVRTRSMQYSGE